MSSNDTKHDVPVQSGCCGGQSASAPAKEHGHHHHHHAHHAQHAQHAHGAKADACCATEASEPAESECCATAEAPKPVAPKVEKKPQGGGCCSH